VTSTTAIQLRPVHSAARALPSVSAGVKLPTRRRFEIPHPAGVWEPALSTASQKPPCAGFICVGQQRGGNSGGLETGHVG
jgi:hypothetical protein